ncbi:MAG: 50S ribosomal protein L28 [Bacteroidales bacterium]|nr:50S ribosomal protein L28 [Bacteroidales bacterium]
MARVCQITGKKALKGNNVSHSKRRTNRKFYPNLFEKKYFIPEENRWIKLRVSAAGMRLIDKKGISEALKEAKEKGLVLKINK